MEWQLFWQIIALMSYAALLVQAVIIAIRAGKKR